MYFQRRERRAYVANATLTHRLPGRYAAGATLVSPPDENTHRDLFSLARALTTAALTISPAATLLPQAQTLADDLKRMRGSRSEYVVSTIRFSSTTDRATKTMIPCVTGGSRSVRLVSAV